MDTLAPSDLGRQEPGEKCTTWPPRGFPAGSDGKESTCNVGDLSLSSASGRSPGEGHDKLLQFSCLENSKDRRAWWATVYGVAKSWTRMSD